MLYNCGIISNEKCQLWASQLSRHREKVMFPSSATLGFERLLDNALKVQDVMSGDHYPPHSVIKTGQDSFEIKMAVAGFSEDDVIVEVKEDILYISSEGLDNEDENKEVLFNRVASRPFKKMFLLGEHIFVHAGTLKDGMLKIELHRKLPHEKKPKRIKLN
jgi:molecular chaperone IbpA